MNTIEELNNYSLDQVEFDDNRDSAVIFNLVTAVDQTISVGENQSFTSPHGIEIVEIIEYDLTDVEVEYDFSNFTGAVTLTFPSSLPSGTTVTETSTNVFTIAPINNVATWDIVKNAIVQPPFRETGFKPYDCTITHKINDAGSFTKDWTVNLTVTPVEYLSQPSDETYLSGATNYDIDNPLIIADPGVFDPTWTFVITTSDTGPITNVSESGSGGTFNYNSSTDTITITGDKTEVNSYLSTLLFDFSTTDNADFTLTYTLTNDLTSDVDVLVQYFENFELIPVQQDTVSTLTANVDKVKDGGVLTVSAATLTADNTRTRDGGSSTMPMTATVLCQFNKIATFGFTPTARFTQSAVAFTGAPFAFNIDGSIGYTQTLVLDYPTLNLSGTEANKWYRNFDFGFTLTGGFNPTIRMDFYEGYKTSPSDTTITISSTKKTGPTLSPENPSNGYYRVSPSTFSGYMSTNTSSPYREYHIAYFEIFISYGSLYTGNSFISIFGDMGDFTTPGLRLVLNRTSEIASWGQDVAAWGQADFLNTYTATTDGDLQVNGINTNTLPNYYPSTWINMNKLFGANFDQDISGWDTSNVENFNDAFMDAYDFNQDISGWDTSSAESMNNMFYDATSFNQDLTGWCVTNITSLPSGFAGGTSGLSSANYPVWGTCP